jgi:hypothetical protein
MSSMAVAILKEITKSAATKKPAFSMKIPANSTVNSKTEQPRFT